MNTTRPQTTYRDPDYWIRFSWIWSLVYLSSLLIPAALAIFSGDLPPRTTLLVLSLIVGGGIWHWLWIYPILRKLRNPYRYPALIAIYLSGLVAIWFVLVRIDPVFYIQLSGLYPQIFIFLPAAWAIPATFLMSGLIFIEQARGDFSNINAAGESVLAADNSVCCPFLPVDPGDYRPERGPRRADPGVGSSPGRAGRQ